MEISLRYGNYGCAIMHEDCFHSKLYCTLFKTKTFNFLQSQSSQDSGTPNSDMKWTIEHVIYPALKSTLLPPKRMADDATFLQIANLPDLYKVFERC